VTIAASVLGGIYGVTVISAFLFIILPRLLAGQAAAGVQAAARPAAGLARAIRPARPRVQRTRWSPSYVRSRPGAYLPREQVEPQQTTRVSAANQVSIALAFVLITSAEGGYVFTSVCLSVCLSVG